MKIRFLFIYSILVFITSNVFSQVRLGSVFSDNMVLQQQSKVAIWGISSPKDKIEIIPSWNGNTYKTKCDENGKWSMKIPTISAGGPYTIAVKGSSEITLKNVLLGEVWLCAGQSNMEMPMKGFRGQPVKGSNDDILKSKNKNLRFMAVPRQLSVEPLDTFNSKWLEASPATVYNFSATAYYFGKLLQEVLDVPVGLIDVSWGGSCIQSWMSRNIAVPFESTPLPEEGDVLKDGNRIPTCIFKGMLYPIIGYGIKGAIWYQGETNFKESEIYPDLLKSMVNEWRTLWGAGEFPFYYVQIAPYDYTHFRKGDDNPKLNSAYTREAQLKAMDSIPNSGIAIILDTGEKYSIHPSDKKTAGSRLAYWAFGNTYGIEGVGYRSPSYKAMEIKDGEIIISFNSTYGITSYGKEIKNVEIAGEDKVFYPAKVKVRSKSMIVSSPEVKNPVAVRYAFTDYTEAELFGTDGLPVSSFRTDNW